MVVRALKKPRDPEPRFTAGPDQSLRNDATCNREFCQFPGVFHGKICPDTWLALSAGGNLTPLKTHQK